MAFDVATGRLKVGLAPTDAVQDAEITMAINTALAIVENYCNRPFLYNTQVEVFQHVHQGKVQVERYPIDTVISMDASAGMHQVQHVAGFIDFHGVRYIERLELTYSGGYKILPADLEFAMWSVFGALWSTFDPTIVAAGGGGLTVAIGAVKKRTVVGVGSVEYETGGGSTSSSSGGAVHADLSAVMPAATMAILAPYKRMSA